MLFAAIMVITASFPAFASETSNFDNEAVIITAQIEKADGTIVNVEPEYNVTKLSDNAIKSISGDDDGELYRVDVTLRASDELHTGQTDQSGADAYLKGTLYYIKHLTYTILTEYEVIYHEGQSAQVWNKVYSYGCHDIGMEHDGIKVTGRSVHKYPNMHSAYFKGVYLSAACEVEGPGVRETLKIGVESK